MTIYGHYSISSILFFVYIQYKLSFLYNPNSELLLINIFVWLKHKPLVNRDFAFDLSDSVAVNLQLKFSWFEDYVPFEYWVQMVLHWIL